MPSQPYRLTIERRDAARNMARFYTLALETDLFGAVCLVRQWGRIGTRGRTCRHAFTGETEAVALFLSLLKAKRRRGYRPRGAGRATTAPGPVPTGEATIGVPACAGLSDGRTVPETGAGGGHC